MKKVRNDPRRKVSKPATRLNTYDVETLEARKLFSTITWTNRGSDGFGAYGASANAARAIVDRAIGDWSRMITNFNYAGNSGHNAAYQLTVNEGALDGGGRGVTNNITVDASGKPYSAAITLDDNGAGGGWYFDPTPGSATDPDDSEFTSLASPYTATDPSVSGNDFYRTIVHEIGHAVGIYVDSGGSALFPQLVNTGVADPNDSASTLYTFSVGGVNRATLTSNGGGHMYEGPAIAGRSDIVAYPNDLLNAGRTIPVGVDTRELISDTDINLLRDAYGYSTLAASVTNTFLVNRNTQSGSLTINGLPGNVNDLVTINKANTSTLNVSVDGYGELIDGNATTGITVLPGDGNDIVRINYNAGKPTFLNADNGNDTYEFGQGTGLLSGVTGACTVVDFSGTDTINLYDYNDTAQPINNIYDSYVSVGTFRVNYDLRVENLNDTTGKGSEVVQVFSLPSTTTLSLNSTAGNDLVYVGFGTVGGTTNVLGNVIIANDNGTSFVTISDQGDTTGRALGINSNTTYGYINGFAGGQIQWKLSAVSEVDITTSSAADVVYVSGTGVKMALSNPGGADSFVVASSVGLTGIASPLTINTYNTSILNSVVLDDTGDATGRTITTAPITNGQQITGLGGSGKVINVVNASYLFIGGSDGNDTFNLNGLGNAVVSGGLGFDFLNITDTGLPTLTFLNFYGDHLDRGNGSTVSQTLNYSAFENMNYSVQATTTTTRIYSSSIAAVGIFSDPISLNLSSSAANTVTVYPHDSLGSLTINGNIKLLGGTAADSLIVDDSAYTGDAIYQVSNPIYSQTSPYQTVAFPGAGRVSAYSNIENISIYGGSGNDEFDVQTLKVPDTLTLRGNDGNDTFDIAAPSGNVFGNFAALSSNLAGQFNFDGGAGSNSLNVHDSNTTVSWADQLSSTQLRHIAVPAFQAIYSVYFNYANIASIFSTTGAYVDTFTLNSEPAGTTWEVDGGGSLDALTVNAGSAKLSQDQDFSSVTLAANTNLSIDGLGRSLYTKALNVGAGATFDLGSNSLVVDYSGNSPLSTVQGLIKQGRDNGAWDGTGITSTTAAANSLHNTTLGLMESANYLSAYGQSATFAGRAIDSTALLVKYTYYGDTDFNGKVDANDYGRLDSGYQNQRSPGFVAGWFTGDLNYDGVIDANDYALIDSAYQTQTAGGISPFATKLIQRSAGRIS